MSTWAGMLHFAQHFPLLPKHLRRGLLPVPSKLSVSCSNLSMAAFSSMLGWSLGSFGTHYLHAACLPPYANYGYSVLPALPPSPHLGLVGRADWAFSGSDPLQETALNYPYKEGGLGHGQDYSQVLCGVVPNL